FYTDCGNIKRFPRRSPLPGIDGLEDRFGSMVLINAARRGDGLHRRFEVVPGILPCVYRKPHPD
ncbi:MAG: hypothetical protein WA756_22430, partial [Pseudolabrys sp.]